MKRPVWTTPLLARHVAPSGMFERPSLMFRVRMEDMPASLPPYGDYCYRWHQLKGIWPEDWVALFGLLDATIKRGSRHKGWKYVDIWPDGAFVTVHLRGYDGESPRPLLPNVVAVLNALQRRGVPVEVK